MKAPFLGQTSGQTAVKPQSITGQTSGHTSGQKQVKRSGQKLDRSSPGPTAARHGGGRAMLAAAAPGQKIDTKRLVQKNWSKILVKSWSNLGQPRPDIAAAGPCWPRPSSSPPGPSAPASRRSALPPRSPPPIARQPPPSPAPLEVGRQKCGSDSTGPRHWSKELAATAGRPPGTETALLTAGFDRWF